MSEVSLSAPEITITKTAPDGTDVQLVNPNGTATFEITVTNTGDVDLENVVILDPETINCNMTFATLPIGASEVYTCSIDSVTVGFVNVVDVTANPVGGGDPVIGTDDANVILNNPAITIAKTATDGTDSQEVNPNGTATFQIVITNTGDVTLENIVVVDSLSPDCNAVIPMLAAGDFFAYNCAANNVTGDFTNVADVTADPLGGGDPVADTDGSDVVVSAPAISITKSAPDGTDTQEVGLNGTASFEIVVTNTGTVDLQNIVVSDPNAIACNNVIPYLLVGQSTSYSCSELNVINGFLNTVVVTADPVGGGDPVTDTDDSDVLLLAPSITVDKRAVDGTDSQTVNPDGTATFEIIITNSGNINLENLVVTDPLSPSCDTTIPTLNTGETVTYVCFIENVTAGFINTIEVTADLVGFDAQITGTDDTEVILNTPALTIEKTAADGTDSQLVNPNGTATFNITVTNSGDVALENIIVTDPNSPTCDVAIALLPPGASTFYTCTQSNVLSSFVNVVNVTADPVGGGTPVSTSDDTDVIVTNPAISVVKAAANGSDTQLINPNGTASFNITVSNTGDVALENILVSDPLAPSCDNVIPLLNVGESFIYTCTLDNVTADFINIIDATADPVGGGDPVGDTDDTEVVLTNPGIAIIKTALDATDLELVNPGGTATFEITVINTGDTDLFNVTVSDPLSPGCDNNLGGILVGQSVSYTCTENNVTGDYTNSAVATGDPVGGSGGDPVTSTDNSNVTISNPSINITKTALDGTNLQFVNPNGTASFEITVTNDGDTDLENIIITDPLSPDCNMTIGSLVVGASEVYVCMINGVNADFINVIDASATPVGGGTSVTDSDNTTVVLTNPAITVTKTAVDGTDTQDVNPNSTATFQIIVTNTGDVDLENVVISDPLAPNCNTTIAILSVNDFQVYNCTADNVINSFTNTVNVTADPVGGGDPATGMDTSEVILSAPGLSIEKTALDGSESQTVSPGGTAEFEITVTNTGTVDLENVVVSDPNSPSCDRVIVSLLAGETTVYTCITTNVTSGFLNTAIVTGDPVGGGDPVTDNDDTNVAILAPSITIEKRATDGTDAQEVNPNGTATFEIIVTNSGNSDLENVVVSDPMTPTCDMVIPSLVIGQIITYTCDATNVNSSFTNVANVTADIVGGGVPVSSTDDTEVILTMPGLVVNKTAADGTDSQNVNPNGTASFNITVTNSGNVALENVTISDPLAPACDNIIAFLPAGATSTYTCTLDNVTAGFINTVNVTAAPVGGGNPVMVSDDTEVLLTNPAITINKEAINGTDSQNVNPNGSATFEITVTNTGDVALENIYITDPTVPDCDQMIATLNVGDTYTYTCTIFNVNTSFTNTASVTADPVGGGDPVNDTDTSDVVLTSPELTVVKTAVDGTDTQSINPNSTAFFEITVTNTGNVHLFNVVLSDPQAPDCNTNIGVLLIGASITTTCSINNVTADFTNVGIATGDPIGGGDPVSGSDDTEVLLTNPGVTISKTAIDGTNTQEINPNSTATFEIVVTNSGDVDLQNIVVTDPLSPNCDIVIPSLAVGASTTYLCSLDNVTANFENIANVTADPVGGGDPVSDSNSSNVVMTNPAISITKTAANGSDLQVINPDGSATFQIIIQNTGDVPLENIVVSDPLSPACDMVIASLAVGELTAYNCVLNNITADFTNIANITADPVGGGDPVSDTDATDVVVTNPSIAIFKTALNGSDSQNLNPGGTAAFEITVTNDGDVNLQNVTISDPLAPDCDAFYISLLVGQTVSYTCSLASVPADFINTVMVSATPAGGGGAVTDSDDSNVVLYTPAVTIDKRALDGMDLQNVNPGGTANFEIVVTNTGNVGLENIVVSDPVAPGCDNVIPVLNIGEAFTYTCTLDNINADFTNTADVTADPIGGGFPVSNTDDTDVVLTMPAVSIAKTAADGTETELINPNGTATFNITVTNSGDTDLENIVVSDPLAPNCDNIIAFLAVGESTTYTCTLDNVTANFTNTANVTGDPVGGGTPVNASDDVNVVLTNPAIAITKTASDASDTQAVNPNATATFTISVMNTGDVDLVNVMVSDPQAPDCDYLVGTLTVGATFSYNCTLSNVLANFTNTANVTADPAGPSGGDPVTGTDDTDVTLTNPAVTIVKTALDGTDTQLVNPNGTASFEITVTNSGDVDLFDIAVSDPSSPDCDTTGVSLLVGESFTYTCLINNVLADFTNIGNVTAYPVGGGDPVFDTDDTNIVLTSPSVAVEKSASTGADTQLINPDGTAFFEVTITNTGDVDLENIVVSDPATQDCDNVIPSLAVGASTTYSCMLNNVTGAFINVANVTANPVGGGDPVLATDDTEILLTNPGIQIVKAALDGTDTQAVSPGGTATFEITVTNTGDVDLENIAVSDLNSPVCNNNILALAVGESFVYTCDFNTVTTGFMNNAIVTADPVGGGGVVTDNDFSEVTLLAPAVVIDKNAANGTNTQHVNMGGTAGFEITVTNTGDVALENVAVSDPQLPDCDTVIAVLNIGESVSYNCEQLDVQGAFINTASVTADPVGGGNPVGDIDNTNVLLNMPEITVEKTATDGNEIQLVNPNGTAYFNIMITNSGDVDLVNIVLTDPLSPDCDMVIASLVIGEVFTYTCSIDNVTANFVNTVNVVADPVGGGDPVGDSDNAHVLLTNPAISITKTAGDGTDTQLVNPNSTADFIITVTNTGDVDLENVIISDPQSTSCDDIALSLLIGESISYNCSLDGVLADFINVANVTADPVGGGDPVTAVDDTEVLLTHPEITIVKTAANGSDNQLVNPNGTATFEITVINTGDVDLENIVITDPASPDCAQTYATLAVGASQVYTCTIDNVLADFVNVVDVTADPVGGGDPVANTDSSNTMLTSPAIAISKTALDGTDTQLINPDGTAVFEITVTNTGDANLENVVITDPLAPDCDTVLVSLSIGASRTYICILDNVPANFTNVINTTADPVGGGDSVSATDDTDVVLTNPAIEIIKTALDGTDTQAVSPGATATFEITVINTGDVGLENIVVTDSNTPSCNNNINTLAVGEVVTYTCNISNVLAGFINTATVTADPAGGGTPVGNNDTSEVTMLSPAIAIVKNAVDGTNTQNVNPNGTATFEISVTNTGDVALENIIVDDPALPNCNQIIGSLAIGETFTYTCNQLNVQSGYTNTATVTASPVGGGIPVDNMDTSDVVLTNPSITVAKTAADGTDTQLVNPNGTAYFNIVVTNDGDVALENIVLDDPLTAGCNTTISLLAVGETFSYTCSLDNVLADFTNIVNVTADPVGGGDPINNSDATDVVLTMPGIAIAKTAFDGTDSQLVNPNGTAYFNIMVTNTGDADLENIIVSDPQSPGCDNVIASLAVGESTTYTCSLDNVLADFTNVANVTADPVGGGDPVAATDDTDVLLTNPAITISKIAIDGTDTQLVNPNGTATFEITVTNTGDVDFENIVVSDPASPDCDRTFATLAVGASEVYTCTMANVTSGFVNVVDVTADPVGGGDPVGNTDNSTVILSAPSIEVVKTAPDGTDMQLVNPDGTAIFEITVINTGIVDLENVVVSDPTVSSCDTVLVSLPVGTSTTYVCTFENVNAGFTNTIGAIADPVGGGDPVNSADSTDVILTTPGIDIVKTAADGSDMQWVSPGGTASFEITVINTGDVDLENVTVMDFNTPDCDNIIPVLAVGASFTYTCSIDNVMNGFRNDAIVVADPVGGGASIYENDSSDISLLSPGVAITKNAANGTNTQSVNPGAPATFEITVNNTGNVDLENVVVSDPALAACDTILTLLAIGETVTYSCTQLNVLNDFTNVANITADPVGGGTPVTDSDDADVVVNAPEILVVKTAINGSNIQTVNPNGIAYFNIRVTNTGSVDLENVVVSDPLTPACDTILAILPVGQTVFYSCTLGNVTTPFTNVANATADPVGGGNPVTATDNTDVLLSNPGIAITKTALDGTDNQLVNPDGTAYFEITVTNTGDVGLLSVTVSDPQSPGCDNIVGNLAVGESFTYTCSIDNISADFINTANVTADPAGGGDPVTATDDTQVSVSNPSIFVSKAALDNTDMQLVNPNGTANFEIIVTNTGDVDLENVVVSDPASPLCEQFFAVLPVGATETYLCAFPNVTAGFVNVANVTADPVGGGGAVTSTDNSAVVLTAPSIEVVKTTLDGTDSQLVNPDGTATFEITVINTGVVDLENIIVSDPAVPACNATFASLAVGASETYICTLDNVTASFTNIANVTADPVGGGDPVTDVDDTEVILSMPGIEIVKAALDGTDSQGVSPGGMVGFEITVTNTGSIDLENILVSDLNTPDCDNSIPALAVGESFTYICMMDNVGTAFTNTAVVTADPVGGGAPVSDDDTSDVFMLTPDILIVKSSKNGNDSQNVNPGGTATFEIAVTNNGNVDLENVVINDPTLTACDTTIALLPIGETVIYTCDKENVTESFTNTAFVAASPVGGGISVGGGSPIGGNDATNVVINVPSIDVVKSALDGSDSQFVNPNGTASFSITVINTGDIDVENVVITDPLAPNCDTTLPALAIGESFTYTCQVNNVSANFINTVNVTADPVGGGNPVAATDDTEVLLSMPNIAITKTAIDGTDSQLVNPNGTAFFEISVSNTGGVALQNVVVSDPQSIGCDNIVGDLAVGQTVTYTCSQPNVLADFINTASVTADPVGGGDPIGAVDDTEVILTNPAVSVTKTALDGTDSQFVNPNGAAFFEITVTNTGDVALQNITVSDPLSPSCDAFLANLAVGASHVYTCSLDNVNADFVNVAEVSAEPLGGGEPVVDTDDTNVVLGSPAIAIAKTSGSGGDMQVVNPDGIATFTITITNTGDVALENIVVSDAASPSCNTTIASLAVGEAHTYTCTQDNVQADFTNVANVTADPVGGGDPVQGTDSTDVELTSPAIDIVKTALDGSDTQFVNPGGTAYFEIAVTNVGNVILENIIVSDINTVGCDNTIATLAAGASFTYVCSLDNVEAGFTNTAIVDAEPVGGGATVSDNDTADVVLLAPAVAIDKHASNGTNSQIVSPGGMAAFEINVTNTGNVDLENVVVSDPTLPACDSVIALLQIGEIVTYSCAVSNVTAAFVNTANVTASPVGGGNPVGDTDDAEVFLNVPDITIVKSALDGSDAQSINPNSTASFNITVTNSGGFDLENIIVNDPLSPACNMTIATLAVGETFSYVCTIDNVTSDFINVASVTADPTDGGLPVSDTDDSEVLITSPSVSISKTAIDGTEGQLVNPGGTATFEIVVSNTGDVDLVDVVVSDPLSPNCDQTIDLLSVGESITYTCTIDNVDADFTNVVDVFAYPAGEHDGSVIFDTDDTEVTVTNPGIVISKQALDGTDSQVANPNGSAAFEITVTNTGDVDLENIVIDDPLTSNCNNIIASLAVGQTEVYTCALDQVATAFTNVASVTATPVGGGDPVNNTDNTIVALSNPSVSITKTAADGTDSQQINPGQTAAFEIVVVNDGDVDLTDIVISDPLSPNCDITLPFMAVGESLTYTCEIANVTDAFINVADVVATPLGGGDSVTATDDTEVNLNAPQISIVKTGFGGASPYYIVPDATATFEITVTNIGNTDLANIMVDDPSTPVCNTTIPFLAVGASYTYTCEIANVVESFVNTASATAFPVGGGGAVAASVDDSDSVAVEVSCPDDALVCNDLVHISLDESCEAVIVPSMILEQDVSYDHFYDVVLSDQDGNIIGNTITAEYVGQTLMVMVVNNCNENGNSCWGNILVEDKLAPEILCPDDPTLDFICTDLEHLYTPDVTELPAGDTLVTGNPIITENCSITLTTYEDNLIEGDMCSDDLIIRTFTTVDGYGNTASCTQQITVGRPSLSDVSTPESFTVNCNDVTDVDPQSLYDLGYDGLPIATTFFGEVPVSQSYCNIGVSFYDAQPVDICGGSYKIIRNWTLFDWCTAASITVAQIIKVEDTDGPTFTCPVYEDVNAITTQGVCHEDVLLLPMENFNDNCSETGSAAIEITLQDGTVQQHQAGDVVTLEAGVYTLTYYASDACDNEAIPCTTTVAVIDGTPPVAVCDANTAVSVGVDGSAYVCTETFDDGSYDNCSDIVVKVKRMDASTGTDFTDCVEFTCTDVGNEVMVRMRVYDIIPADGFDDDDDGRFNECMVTVIVSDKLDPELVCPADKTIECQGDFSTIAELSDNPNDGAATFFNGTLVGYYAGATDNCNATVTVTDSVDVDNCGVGTVIRTWVAQDDGGRSVSCQQTISLINDSPFDAADIGWPQNHYVDCGAGLGIEPEDFPVGYNVPQITEDACDLIAVTYEDTFLEFSEESCYKILRKWTVVDWCQFKDHGDVNYDEGYWEFTQIIFVTDDAAPVITASCEMVEFCSFEIDCGAAPAELILTAEDACATNLNYSYSIDAFNDGVVDNGSAFNGNTNDASGNYPLGIHRIYWSVEDGCGNISTCDYLFRIVDCKQPTPVLLNGLSTTIMPTGGTVDLDATAFDAPNSGSFDNCTASEDLLFFIRIVTPDNTPVETIEDIYALGTTVSFDCSNYGFVEVEIYVVDEAGNWESGITLIEVQDPNGVCTEAPELADLMGDIYTENDDMVSGVSVAVGNTSVEIPGMMTGIDGHYGFQVPMEENYVVVPEKDDDPLNGVTTFDLVLISKHVLGVALLDSPYKIIAADANRSNSITTFDLVQIRRLILSIDETFPNNTSWRFVDADFVFPDPTNPFLTVFPEVITINDMIDNSIANDFIGVKIGDVNGNAVPGFLGSIEAREFEHELLFEVGEQNLVAGESYAVDFTAKEFTDILGYQFTLNFDKEALSFVDLETGELDGLAATNFGLALLEEGAITASWNHIAGKTMKDGRNLFRLHFKALKDGLLSEWMHVDSRFTDAEAYNKVEELGVALQFVDTDRATIATAPFELYQNIPNPFDAATIVGFHLPEASSGELRIFDIQGNLVRIIAGDFAKGHNELKIDRNELPESGMLFYQLRTKSYTATKMMILID